MLHKKKQHVIKSIFLSIKIKIKFKIKFSKLEKYAKISKTIK